MCAGLKFQFLPSEESHDHQARVIVDERDILQEIDKSALGLDPVEFFAQKSLLHGGELLIGRCCCGCIGCGDEPVTVIREHETIIWTTRHPWLARLEFDLPNYERAVQEGATDTSWENLERTVERVVASLDFSTFARRGLKFDWASARFDNETLRLSFQEGSAQRLFSVPWDHRTVDGAIVAVKAFMSDEG